MPTLNHFIILFGVTFIKLSGYCYHDMLAKIADFLQFEFLLHFQSQLKTIGLSCYLCVYNLPYCSFQGVVWSRFILIWVTMKEH